MAERPRKGPLSFVNRETGARGTHKMNKSHRCGVMFTNSGICGETDMSIAGSY